MKNKQSQFFFVLLMGGSSTRFKAGIKILHKIDAKDHPIFLYPLKFALTSRIFFRIIVVFNSSLEKTIIKNINKCFNESCLPKDSIAYLDFVSGGKERPFSSFNALHHIKHKYYSDQNQNIYVLIHDAGRPYLNKNTIRNLKLILNTGEDAVIPLLKGRDAIKLLDDHNLKTAENNYRLAQTPQGFSFFKLYNAYKKINLSQPFLKDDAAVYEKLYGSPLSINGSILSHKLTYREDLSIIQPILKKYAYKFSHFSKYPN